MQDKKPTGRAGLKQSRILVRKVLGVARLGGFNKSAPPDEMLIDEPTGLLPDGIEAPLEIARLDRAEERLLTRESTAAFAGENVVISRNPSRC